MFIEFPDFDFQFSVTETDDVKTIAKWFSSNGVEPIFTQRMGRGYFTVRSKRMYYAFNEPVESLPELNLFDNDKLLLNNVIKAILKELGYYRKGMKDPVIQHILNAVNNPSLRIPNELHKLVNFISFRGLLYYFLLDEGRSKFNKEHLYSVTFYTAIWNLAVTTYAKMKNMDCSAVVTEDSYIINRVVQTSGHYRTDFYNSYNFRYCLHIHPKQFIKQIKSELKPTVVGNEQLAHDIIGDL